ncbi:hypothetical protein [Nocardia nepalensis]|uniref:hypothetical protein n=1 Tax=Nocardia nepalensis TaxID=3375448 RepID=UPI003B68606A
MSDDQMPAPAMAVNPLQQLLDQLLRSSLPAPWTNRPATLVPVVDPQAFTPLDDDGNRIPRPGVEPNPPYLSPADHTRASWTATPPRFVPKTTGNQRDEVDPYLSSWIDDSVEYGQRAGIDPRLVMAIVLNEGGSRALETGRAGATAYDLGRWATDPIRGGAGNSLGLTNMKEPTFNELKKQYPAEFAGHQWSDLMTDEHLAVKATAFALKRLEEDPSTGGVPETMKEKISLNEYLAAGYNAGEKQLREYRGAGDLGPAAAGYAQRADENFARADELMQKMYVQRADGGAIHGPGSSIGDKIPAWLSDGEFVMNARSTALNRPFLQALNADPHYLQHILATLQERPHAGAAIATAVNRPQQQPLTVNMSVSSQDDVVGRLKILAQQWELLHTK